MKLSKPDLLLALTIAKNLGFDMDLMCELLPVGVAAMNVGLNNEYSSEEIINTA
ncbi:MAG: hypothetical protein NC218_04390 [Acetobacter sp.]|nr:hypothetical protein [Acetobacter sp.]